MIHLLHATYGYYLTKYLDLFDTVSSKGLLKFVKILFTTFSFSFPFIPIFFFFFVLCTKYANMYMYACTCLC